MRALGRAVRDMGANPVLNGITVVTVGFSALMVGAFALFFLNVSAVLDAWAEELRIMAYLADGTPPDAAGAVGDRIRRLPGVAGADFVSRETALERLQAQMGDQASLIRDLGENPLPDAYEVRMSVSFREWDRFEALAGAVAGIPGVEDVEYGRQWLGRFIAVFRLFQMAGAAVGGVFVLAAVFFVANTIRLTLYGRRDEIAIMRLVGATEGFIKSPFYIQAVFQGALGGGLGILALYGAFTYTMNRLAPDLSIGALEIRFLPPEIQGGIVLAGMVLGWLGCFITLGQFFRSSAPRF